MTTKQEQHIAEHDQWAAECEGPNNWDQITYWTTVLITAICTVFFMCGATGYAWGRWGHAITTFFTGA